MSAYLSVYKGQKKGTTKLSTSTGARDHPFVEQAYQLLQEAWEQVQGMH